LSQRETDSEKQDPTPTPRATRFRRKVGLVVCRAHRGGVSQMKGNPTKDKTASADTLTVYIVKNIEVSRTGLEPVTR
jgi:hypothetical protein